MTGTFRVEDDWHSFVPPFNLKRVDVNAILGLLRECDSRVITGMQF